MSPGGQGRPQSAQPGLVHPSYLLSTPSKPWLDVTNVQPHFRVEAVLRPIPKRHVILTSPPLPPSLFLASSAEK